MYVWSVSTEETVLCDDLHMLDITKLCGRG
jgi:hypothetical protein